MKATFARFASLFRKKIFVDRAGAIESEDTLDDRRKRGMNMARKSNHAICERIEKVGRNGSILREEC